MDTKLLTVEQALADPKFKLFFNTEIDHIKKQRTSILEEAAGMKSRFKSDSFSTLEKMGMLTSAKIENEYHLIWYKKSNLSKRERDWIEDLVKVIIGRVIRYYDDENAKRRKDECKPKQ